MTSEALSASIADATTFYRQRFRPGPGIALGDINLARLPVSAAEPFSENKGRSEHYREERDILCSMCDAFQLAPRLPEQILSPPEGPYAVEGLTSPITRMPQGRAMQHDIPSCLDYPMIQCNVAAQVLATW